MSIMSSKINAFDDFVDDCFIANDSICRNRREARLELAAPQLIPDLFVSEKINTEDLVA